MKNWIALAAVCVVAVAGLTACGGGDSKEDARASAIGALSENAVDAWSQNGAAGLHSFFTQSVLARCSVDQLETALSGQPKPTAWRNTKDFKFSTEGQATATVIVVSNGQDVPQTWTFELEANTRWRVLDLPGLSECHG